MNSKIIKIVKIILLIFSFCSLFIVFNASLFKLMGQISWIFLLLVMIIRPLQDVFSKNKILNFIGKFRREFGIVAGTYGIAHGLGAILEYSNKSGKSVLEVFFEPYVWNFSSYLAWGMVAMIVCVPLLVTSNGFSVKILQKHWKTLQRLSYFMFIFTVLHVYFLKKEIQILIPFILWILLYLIAFIKNFKAKKNMDFSTPKWLCVPCGWIYDETIGDIDSGIMPGTKFEDIPEDWLCPVCGVGKSDFVLLKGPIELNYSKIYSIKYLTDDVIELKLKYKKDMCYISGQFVSFKLKDKAGSFDRSYSIAEKDGNIYTFLIKIKSDGRGGQLFKKFKKGRKLATTLAMGNFTLQRTSNKKVFIATGTGLAPIYSMIINTPENVSKKLFFGVARKKDLFYLEHLEKIKNLEINIFLSREETEEYNYGRIDLNSETFDKNSEFYMCGSEGLIVNSTKTLKSMGFDKIYSEEFS